MTQEIHECSEIPPISDLEPPRRSVLRNVLIIITCFLATFSNTNMMSGTNITLPDIGRDLHIQQGSLQWIPSAYALSSGCFLLLCGRLADLYGRKLVFLAGAIWMGTFSLGCGFSRTANQLLILRGLQGIGGAACVTSAIGVLAQSFPPGRTRSIGFAVFSAGAPFGAAAGFNFGGLITELSTVRWRGVFFLGAGFAALTFLVGLFSISRDKPSTETDTRVDWVGTALVTTGLVLIMLVLGQGELAPRGWGTPYIIVFLTLGIFLVISFVFWEQFLTKHSTRPPLVHLDIFTRAQGKVGAILLIALLQFSAFMSWMLWVQLYYQTYKNYTPIQTMLRFIPATVTGLTLNFIVGMVVGWLPAIYLLVIGTIATGVACLLFAIIDVNAPWWAYAFPSTVLTVWGADFIFACGSIFISRIALPHEQSVAGGLFSTFTQLGASFGLAITTAVHNAVANKETLRLGIIPNAQGSNVPPQAQLLGYRAAQWTGFGFAMSALVVSILLFRGVGIVGGKEEVNTLRGSERVSSEKGRIEENPSLP